MKTATVTEFRANAKELLDKIEMDQDILILSRPKSKEGFVVLTTSHYEALEETAHLLSTQANAKWLTDSVAQHKAGKVNNRKLIEVKQSKKRV
ncbi:MAG: type II toxin-antitoxin system prevent-host-death family antitoxin [Cyclobacteriaceae bacterium]|jgi:antitoxin YefM|nr:type II toxin-antitoxin system prevent-host-death family antitoxin [Flammeovirgaceae bacterium]MCZ8022748.1 type II toxin-antitoxin system prevent-host-death family antitoxin [Cytophagales bacterium]MCZ8327563.1 type II toxin-antitoxin system prevent-host-death family antitoxin [Cyclobacteriaceae bacterium]